MSDDEGRESIHLGDLGSQIDHLLALGQVDRARQITMDWIARDPDNPGGHLMLAHVLTAAGKLPEALDVLGRVLSQMPDNDHAHSLRADVLLSLGRFADAEASIRRAIEIDPTVPSHFATLARILYVCDLNIEALKYTELALSLDPDDAWLHQLRSEMLLVVHPRHWGVSEEAVRTSLRLNPESSHSHAILGMILIRDRRRTEAEAALRESLRLNPNNSLAILGLSELVKGQYWWYRPMLEFGQLMSRLGRDGQIGVIFGLWALHSGVQALIPPEATWGDFVTLAYAGFCLYTWFAEPITRGLLRRAYPWLR